MKEINEILRYFPNSIYQFFSELYNEKNIDFDELQEIRLRTNRPIILRFRDRDLLLKYNVFQTEILQVVEKICENSIYAYKNQICEGFITIKGGHRVGITGTCVIENNKIINVKNISSLNFRIARQVFDCSNRLLKEIINRDCKTIYNTIIVSPPGRGKTTILRDLIRNLSNGIIEKNFEGINVGVVDERGEIAAMYRGIPQNDVGIRTDIIENVNKSQGIHILIRTMAPEIIACDEIGSKEDVDAIYYALFSGVKGIFTMHGRNLNDIKNNEPIYRLIENNQIEKVIFL